MSNALKCDICGQIINEPAASDIKDAPAPPPKVFNTNSQPPNVEVGPLSLRFVIKGQGDTHPACFWTELASVADKQGGGRSWERTGR